MRVTVLCTDAGHPVVPYLQRWRDATSARGHEVRLASDKSQLAAGDILFLVSCSQVIPPELRKQFGATLVLHASDLPRGRGWSPHIWGIVGGESRITVCLLEAADSIDSGAIWLRRQFMLDGHELLPEINRKLFSTELELMTAAVEQYGRIAPQPQIGEPGEYLRKRTPQDSELDPHKTLAEQFDLLRVVDSQRYPAILNYRGHRYVIKIEKDSGHVQDQ